jgi:hypothetical protein
MESRKIIFLNFILVTLYYIVNYTDIVQYRNIYEYKNIIHIIKNIK